MELDCIQVLLCWPDFTAALWKRDWVADSEGGGVYRIVYLIAALSFEVPERHRGCH